MNLLTPVSTIMTSEVITLAPTDNLSQVKEIFEGKNIHHIVVVSRHRPVGMVSKSDYLSAVNGFALSEDEKRTDALRLRQWEVSDIMTDKLAKVETTDSIRTVLEVFKLNLFHALPVVEDGYLVGIVTTFDIIKSVAEEGVRLEDYKANESKHRTMSARARGCKNPSCTVPCRSRKPAAAAPC